MRAKVRPKNPKVLPKEEINNDTKKENPDGAFLPEQRIGSDVHDKHVLAKLELGAFASESIDKLYLEKVASRYQKNIECTVCRFSGRPTLEGYCPKCGSIGGVPHVHRNTTVKTVYNRNQEMGLLYETANDKTP